MVIQSEAAVKVYDSAEEAIRRNVVTKLFGSQLDGIRIDAVDRLRREVSRAEENAEAMREAKENAELKTASTKKQLDAAFTKIEEYLERLEAAKARIDTLA
jgi:NAD-specific glutamate dehydrogenase